MNSFSMIKRCFERQWAGLPEGDRKSINRHEEMGNGPTFIESNVGKITRFETALWYVQPSSIVAPWQTRLMSVKSEWYE